ncbi:MAG: hypothetical protein JW812_01115 [Alphaproteobacteria bacterium]|nr:hypothetical protein [Alphaproteobacteria bacterium]MBN2779611.1 hypothetical protein [Alphaproteobacteria bacterium]
MKKNLILIVFFILTLNLNAQETIKNKNLTFLLSYDSEKKLSEKQIQSIIDLPIIDLNEDLRLGEEDGYLKGKLLDKSVSFWIEGNEKKIKYENVTVYFRGKTPTYLSCNDCRTDDI